MDLGDLRVDHCRESHLDEIHTATVRFGEQSPEFAFGLDYSSKLKVGGSGNAAFGSMKLYCDTEFPPGSRQVLRIEHRGSC